MFEDIVLLKIYPLQDICIYRRFLAPSKTFTFSTLFTLTMSQLIEDQYTGYPNIKTKNLATTLIFIFQFDEFFKDQG